MKIISVLGDWLENKPDGRVPIEEWQTHFAPQVPHLSPPPTGPLPPTNSQAMEGIITVGAPSPPPEIKVEDVEDAPFLANNQKSHSPPIFLSARTTHDSPSPRPSPLSDNPKSDETEVDMPMITLEEVGPITSQDPRRTTGGKSIDIMRSTGLFPKRVTLLIGKRKKEEEEYKESEQDSEDQESPEADDNEMDVDGIERKEKSRRKPKTKKTRIVSQATIENSDADEEKATVKRAKTSQTEYKTFDSPNPCAPCMMAKARCRTFHPKYNNGRDRKACKRCHRLKKRCPFANMSKRELTDSEGEVEVPEKSKKLRRKTNDEEEGSSVRRNQRRKTRRSEQTENPEEKKLQRRKEKTRVLVGDAKKVLSISKGKGKSRETGDQPDEETTKGEDMDWQTGKLVNGCLVSFSQYVYGSRERPTWPFLWTYAAPTAGGSTGHRGTVRSASGR
jgi:hypothetical protein